MFNISYVYADNTVKVNLIEDKQLLELIYETEEYKSGKYCFYVARNDLTYYKIIFLLKTDNLKVYIDSFSGGSYNVIYNASTLRVCYFAEKNPTTLRKQYSSKDTFDKLYNSGSGEFYANFSIYADNTYKDFFLIVPTSSYQIQEIAKVEELPKVIMETMKIIIPIGLVIFGILLLILLIKSVISQMT